MGPSKGMRLMDSAAEAATMPSVSGGCSSSTDNTVMITWISLCIPLGKRGRILRSVRRADRMASVPGRPSRRKKLPGILPTAYSLSSNSTVNGRKSIPSRRCSDITAVASNMVSPHVMVTAPCACCARRPVSITIVWPPISPVTANGFISALIVSVVVITRVFSTSLLRFGVLASHASYQCQAGDILCQKWATRSRSAEIGGVGSPDFLYPVLRFFHTGSASFLAQYVRRPGGIRFRHFSGCYRTFRSAVAHCSTPYTYKGDSRFGRCRKTMASMGLFYNG